MARNTVEHEMETPVISNREATKESHPPPFELPKPALNETESTHSRDQHGDSETAVENLPNSPCRQTPLHAETIGSVASTQGATTTATPRFSSEQTPPIVLDKWPTSRDDENSKTASIPQTISVQKKSEAASIRGIPNYGQTCFLNSVLQSLASLGAFDVYLDTQIRANNRVRRSLMPVSIDEQEESSSLALTQKLLDGLRFINGKNSCSTHWDPRGVLKAVAASNEQFKNIYQQQDAQELLTTLLDVLVEEQDSKPRQHHQPLRESWSWRPSPPEHPRPAAVSLSCAVPATVWALSSSFLQLRLPVLPVDETNCNEDDWNNDIGYDGFEDDDTITVVSATRELAQKRRHERKESLSSLSANNNTSDNSNKQKSGATGTATTSASSTTSTLLPTGEDKTQEDFELNIPRVNSETNMSDMSSSVAMQPSQNLSTTASVSTARTRTSQFSSKQHRAPQVRWTMPLSGWMGSTLQCRKCEYVRPIRNVPFVDLSISPTDVSPHSMAKINPHSHSRPCTVEECLSNFTKVERVESVECPMCTKNAHVAKAQEEVDFWQFTLDDATSLQKRKGKQGESSELLSIREELDRHVVQLEKWQHIDCDDENCAKDMADLLHMEENGEIDSSRIMLRQDSNKCLFLTRLPPVLCLHVQRRFYDPRSGQLSKSNQPVLFHEYLNVAPFCAYSFKSQGSDQGSNISSAPSWAAGTYNSQQQQQQTNNGSQTQRQIFYRLTAVLEHRGGANSGHYVCYRRSPHGWCYVSDNDVRRVTWQTVQQCQAYMLFYENSNMLEHSL